MLFAHPHYPLIGFWTPRMIWADTEPMQDDSHSSLLIIAGPGGSGKTTFLRALYDRRLPSEILSILPESLSSAPYIHSKYPRTLNQPPRESIPPRTAVVSAQKQGRILHYALNKLLKDAPEHSNQSLLLLDFLQTTNETVVVVTVQTDRKTLAKQYGKRMFYDRRPWGGAANRLLDPKSIFEFLSLTRVAQYFAYRFTQKVPRMYQEWFSLIDRVLLRAAANNAKPSIYCIVVEPCLKGASEKAFRILASPRGCRRCAIHLPCAGPRDENTVCPSCESQVGIRNGQHNRHPRPLRPTPSSSGREHAKVEALPKGDAEALALWREEGGGSGRAAGVSGLTITERTTNKDNAWREVRLPHVED